MEEQQLKATDLVELLGVSKGYVSEMLNYKKGMSKEVIRKLAERFKVSHEAFNSNCSCSFFFSLFDLMR